MIGTKSVLHSTLQEEQGKLLIPSSDVTKWPPWKLEGAANGGGEASQMLEEMHVNGRAWMGGRGRHGPGGFSSSDGEKGCRRK